MEERRGATVVVVAAAATAGEEELHFLFAKTFSAFKQTLIRSIINCFV